MAKATGRFGVVRVTAPGVTEERWAAVNPAGALLASGTRSEAIAAMTEAWTIAGRPITAAAPGAPLGVPPGAAEAGRAFYAVLTFEGVETSDGRCFDAFTWRTPPLPFLAQFQTDDYHDGAFIVGRLDTIERDGTGFGARILGTGIYDVTEEATYAAHLAEQGMMVGVSVDPTGSEVPEWECMAYDDEGRCTRERVRWPTAEICAATQVATPAFRGARVSLDGMPETAPEDRAPREEPPEPPEVEFDDIFQFLFASAQRHSGVPAAAVSDAHPCGGSCGGDCCGGGAIVAGAPLHPPRGWFERPGDLAPETPLTITDEGQVFGYAWHHDSCHTGYPNRCVQPPAEPDFPYFLNALTRCADGSDVQTGKITFGTGHADLSLSADQARAHYDNSATPAADVVLGVDEYGAWFAGALRPNLSDEQIRELRSTGQVSGDWREIGGRLRLVACLSVPVAGFPIPRARVASAALSRVLAMVAAGTTPLVEAKAEPWRADIADLRRTVEGLTRVLAASGALDQAADAITASVPTRT